MKRNARKHIMKKSLVFIFSVLTLVSLFSVTSVAKEIGEKPFALLYIDPPLYENEVDKTKQTFEVAEGDSLAYRFATINNGGTANMTGFWVLHTSQDEVTYDVRVYRWAYNYANTIASVPVAEVSSVVYKDPDTTQDEWFFVDFGTSLEAGEYLVVWDNISGGTLTECKFTPDPCFRPYLNGKPIEDYSLWWAAEFDVSGGTYYALPLADDCEVPESTEPPATSEPSDTTKPESTADVTDSTKQDTEAPVNTDNEQTDEMAPPKTSAGVPVGAVVGIVIAVVAVVAVVVVVIVKKRK